MSSLDEELVSIARRVAGAVSLTPVGRVFVPPPDLGPDRDGSFCAVQLADGSTGLAYILLGDTRRRLQSADPAARPVADPLALAQGLTRDDPADRSIALACVNAISRHLLDRAGYAPDFATNSLGSLDLRPGDRLGMVGFFPPLVRRAKELGIRVTVLELKPELVQEGPELTVTLDPARLRDCTKLVCTSTTLLNGSLERLLAHVRHATTFVVIGPSAGFVPDPLFARGVTGVGGAWVTDPVALMDRAGRGEPWGDATRKYSVWNDARWPGLEELLRRATAR